MSDVSQLEPKPRKRVNTYQGSGGLTKRVQALEADMVAVKADIKTAAENTEQLLAILTATKGAAAFAKKHGPRFVAFVTGTLAAAGIGNPAVWRFIGTFFG